MFNKPDDKSRWIVTCEDGIGRHVWRTGMKTKVDVFLDVMILYPARRKVWIRKAMFG